jgi:hypothetical protein
MDGNNLPLAEKADVLTYSSRYLHDDTAMWPLHKIIDRGDSSSTDRQQS